MNIINFICKYTNLKIRISSWVFLGISVLAFVWVIATGLEEMKYTAFVLSLSMSASLIAIALILLNISMKKK